MTELPQRFRLDRRRGRRDDTPGLQPVDQVASPDKGIAVLPSAIVQPTLGVQMSAKPRERPCIQRVDRQSDLRGPTGESPGTAQMHPALVARVAFLRQPSGEVVQVGTGRAGAKSAKRERVLEVVGQHAVLLS